MKLLFTLTLIFSSSVFAKHGIERHEESPMAKNYSWNDILKSPTLDAESQGVIHPSIKTSLFNVCNYNENMFKTIKPKRTCLEHGMQHISGRHVNGGKPGDQVKACIKWSEPKNKIIKNTYTKCTKEEYTEIGQTRKDSITQVKCLERTELLVPQMQLIDVYQDRKNYQYKFSKIYSIPNCYEQDSDIPDSELPDTKEE